MAQNNSKKLLSKMIRKGNKGYPMATIALYGPNRVIATKAVCAIIKHDGADPEPIKKWLSTTELRKSGQVLSEVLDFLNENDAKTVSIIEETIGCPHEEGIDYPDGSFCPKCIYWKGRDRFSGEMLQ